MQLSSVWYVLAVEWALLSALLLLLLEKNEDHYVRGGGGGAGAGMEVIWRAHRRQPRQHTHREQINWNASAPVRKIRLYRRGKQFSAPQIGHLDEFRWCNQLLLWHKIYFKGFGAGAEFWAWEQWMHVYGQNL